MKSGQVLRASGPPIRMVAALVLLLLLPSSARAGGVGVSIAGRALGDTVTLSTTQPFQPYRLPPEVSRLARRDVEFHWSTRYADQGKSLAPGDLDAFGRMLADSASNPFAFQFPDIQLIVDYTHFTNESYNWDWDPSTGPGFVIRPLVTSWGYDTLNASHIDNYVYYPGPNGDDPDLLDRGQSPSAFKYALEDTSTGRDTTLAAVLNLNSTMIPGPDTSQVGVNWFLPGTVQNWGFGHEMQHALNRNNPSGPLGELLSSAVEALIGENDDPPRYDTPFTWSLFRSGSNYQAWRALGAYIVYNFRGADTTRTLSGAADDLLWRWCHTSSALGRNLTDLASELSDAECNQCDDLSYFNGLSDSDRLRLLIHNWRVANYLQDYTKAEHQYGYDPYFGFRPDSSVGYWQDVDGDTTDNAVAIPPEVTVAAAQAYAPRYFSRTVYSEATSDSLPMAIDPYGAHYWVIRSDPGLSSSTRELVIEVAPEGVARFCDAGFTGRLYASVIPYGEHRDSTGTWLPLWANSKWAGDPLLYQSVDVDSGAAPLTLAVPNFGNAWKAAVLVLSLEDTNVPLNASFSATGVLPYRLSLSLRDSTASGSVTPVTVADVAGKLECEPTWSPDGDEIAYGAARDGETYRLLYRKGVSSGAESLLVKPKQPHHQYRPDWSPRGDWVAFDQDASPSDTTRCDIWVYNTETESLVQLTSRAEDELAPAFSPNGQHLAYTRWFGQEQKMELRRVNLDGTGDMLLWGSTGISEVPEVRWTPDGQSVYFVLRDSLFSVGKNGGIRVYHADAENIKHLDFHRGGGQVLVERTGLPACGYGSSVWRVAVWDTASDDTRGLVYENGQRFMRPRWSYDGRRITYCKGPDAAGQDRGVYVATVTYNAAPAFASTPRDTVVTNCGTLTMDVDATDPDGQTVSFEAAMLPQTAVFNGSTGTLTWDVPLSGDHYFVVRALDGTGGMAQRVVKISVPDSIRPDSLTLSEALVSSNLAWIEWLAVGDDSLTSTACKYEVRQNSSPITEANWSSSPHVFGTVPSPASPGSLEDMTITGLSPSTTYYFAMKVRDEAGDHWSKLSNVIQVHTTSGGGGLSVRRSGPGEASARGATATSLDLDRKAEAAALIGSSHALALELDRSGGGLSWLMYRLGEEETSTVASGANGAQVITQSAVGSEWTSDGGSSFASQDTILSVHSRLADGTRLVFLGDHRLVLASELAHGLEVQSATHNRLGNLLQDLAPASGEFELDSGDSLLLVYAATQEQFSPTAGFLTVRRVGTGSTPTSRLPQLQQLPKAFQLAQNHPNPFAVATTIRFDLPKGEQVRLEIFDAQGRRVARLANGWYPAGFHAVAWDRSGEGGRLQPGVYLYRIQAGAFRDQKKLVLLP